MPKITLVCLDCAKTEDNTKSDTCRLEISLDNSGWAPVMSETKNLNNGERWLLNKSYSFSTQVHIKLWDNDDFVDDLLGEITISNQIGVHKFGKFNLDDAEYFLWYHVLEEGKDAISQVRYRHYQLRQMMGRMWDGRHMAASQPDIFSDRIYYCRERISVLEKIRFHAAQDNGKSNTKSIKTWIDRHCNPLSEETIIPVTSIPEGYTQFEIGSSSLGLSSTTYSNWEAVRDEKSYCLAGYQHSSHQTDGDWNLSHETMDWNWDQIPDAPFSYLLSATSGRIGPNDLFPYMENEWEMGSMPLEFRPFWGEYVTNWGRHIYDLGHSPVKTEIHPAHTIVREHTTAAPLGQGGAIVPANRAIIGMSASGGFPGNVGTRWLDETGNMAPSALLPTAGRCWFTNLKKHPLRHQMYPPVPRPSQTAILNYRVFLCELIQVKDWSEVDDFLALCRHDDPSSGGEDLAFRKWGRLQGLPDGFTPVVAPQALHPKIQIRDNSYLDIEVDLSQMAQIPVGYYAIVECGWSERGSHQIYQFDVTFETLTSKSFLDELWLYYGVNGQWEALYNELWPEHPYHYHTPFKVYTIGSMPLSIRDCGIEWWGFDNSNDHLDRLKIVARGHDHFSSLVQHPGIHVLDSSASTVRFKAEAWAQTAGQRFHEWIINIHRKAL